MRIWLTLTLVVVLGCNFDSSPIQTIDNGCASDADCPVGACSDNICVDDSGASIDVTIEVLRGDSDLQRMTPASWAIASASFSGSGDYDVALPAIREVRGTVRWDGLRVPAAVRFVRRMGGAIASLVPVPVDVDTFRDASGGEAAQGDDFSAVLVAGEIYDVIVSPSNDMVTADVGTAPAVRSLPPLYLELRVEDDDPTTPLRFDVVFPSGLSDDCTPNVNSGCTLAMALFSLDKESVLPEPGLQIRAIDRQTGRVVSSIGETDENGRVAIRIGEFASDYLIRVTSGVGRDPFPAVSVDPKLVFANDPDNKRIFIPRLNRVQYTGRVRDSDGSAVPGATVRFLSTGIFGGAQLGLEGSFSASATTDEEGRFGAELLPGFYSVTVTPPEDVENSWGVLSAEALVGEEITATESLVVPPQVGLRGWVTTFRDETAIGVTVLARARAAREATATHRSQEAVSNDLGAFAMSVDVGLYDINVKPSSETGFAWLVEPELVMDPGSAESIRGYRLQPPIPVQGVLRTHDGEVVPNALVRAYVLTGTEGSTTRPIQVAETLSGDDGSYRLLIAPRFGDE